MRNIRVADRADWVFEHPKPIPPKRHGRLRDWLATIPMILVIPALVLPFIGAHAEGATLDVTPATVAAGDRVTVRGANLPKGAATLAWDGVADKGSALRVKGNGAFRATVDVPAKLGAGKHELTVVSTDADPVVLSAATVTVVEEPPPPTPAPTPRPTPRPTPEPTPDPTPAPTPKPTPAPTTVPTPVPTTAPTPVPTTAPTTVPTPVPTTAPTPVPTPVPTTAPTPVPTPGATPIPTPIATPVATPSPTPTPIPTPAATPTPTPIPTPIPTPAATPTPPPVALPPADPWSVPFATRPGSAAVRLANCSNVVIENKTFKDLGAGVAAIRIENCSHVTIRAVDFVNVAEGIYALNSSDITIVDGRYSNITGPAQPRTGANVANFVQFNNVAGGLISHNKGKGGDTEDIVSIYQSDHVTVQDNHFEGTNWTSASGSGIALSDGGGSFNVAQRNILLNPGQVGVFIAGGTSNKILDNIVYGEQRPNSNVGLYVWNQSSSACSGQEVSRNRVFWRNAGGSSNPAWNAGNCGTVAGWSTNIWNASLDLTALRVTL